MDGNNLHCEGATLLIKPFAEQAVFDELQKQAAAAAAAEAAAAAVAAAAASEDKPQQGA